MKFYTNVKHHEARTITLVNLPFELQPFEHLNENPLCKLETISDILMKRHTNLKLHEMMCRTHEPKHWFAYFWSYCPLNNEHGHFYHLLDSPL